jgi:hypothetical protein
MGFSVYLDLNFMVSSALTGSLAWDLKMITTPKNGFQDP